MTRADLICAVRESIPAQTTRTASEVVEAVLETVKQTLQAGEVVMVSGFGKFSVRKPHSEPHLQSCQRNLRWCLAGGATMSSGKGSSPSAGSGSRTWWDAAQAKQVLDRHARESGPLAAFAAREGLDVKRLGRWRRRLGWVAPEARSEPAALFVPVSIAGAKPAAPEPSMGQAAAGATGMLEVVLAGERRIRVPAGFDEATLCRLVLVLEGVDRC